MIKLVYKKRYVLYEKAEPWMTRNDKKFCHERQCGTGDKNDKEKHEDD